MKQFNKAIVGIIGGTVLFAVAVAMKQIGKMFLSVFDFPKHYIAWTDIKQRMILLMVFVDRQLQKKQLQGLIQLQTKYTVAWHSAKIKAFGDSSLQQHFSFLGPQLTRKRTSVRGGDVLIQKRCIC